MECKMDTFGLSTEYPKFIEGIIEIIEHKTCKNGKQKLSLQQQYVSEMYRLVL